MFKKFSAIFRISKRKKFIIVSLLLSLALGSIRFLDDNFRYLGIATISLGSVLLSVWCLWEGLTKKTLIVLTLPLYFTLNVSWFWFLLPNNFYSVLPVIIGYGIFLYLMYLTLNIYMVTVVKTIALFRTALSVGFVLSLFIFFLMFDNIFSLKLPIFISSPMVFIFSMPMIILNLWTVDVTSGINKKIVQYAIILSLVVAELASAIFFWPVKLTILSLFLTASIYVSLGLSQINLQGRLFSSTIREYLSISIFVLISLFLTTSWK